MTIIQTILLTTFLPLFALANSNSNFASTAKVNAANVNTAKIILTVAIEEIGYPPYEYEENGEIKGFTIDILKYFEVNSNYDFEYIMLPWPRALHLVAQGQVDMILTLFKKPEREKIYHYIEPHYGYEVNQFFTLADKDIEFTGQLQQLSPYSIGTKRSFSYGQKFDQANYLTKLPALTEAVLLKLLLAGRVDIALSNPFIFSQLINEKNVGDKIKPIQPYLEITPVYLALTKKREDAIEIKETLGKLTERLKKSPYYQELLERYLLDFK